MEKRKAKTDSTPAKKPKIEHVPKRRTDHVPKQTTWPPWLASLQRIHRALNVVCTFCSARKHILTTFATIRTAVEVHLGANATLEESDVAAIACLLGKNAVQFDYVDEVTLRLDAQEQEQTSSSRQQTLAADASVGGVTGRLGLGAQTLTDVAPQAEYVLYFAFVDEDLKKEKAGGTASKSKNKSKLQLPAYGQKQMTNLIGKRDARFVKAVEAYLGRCSPGGEDVEARLRQEAAAFLPVRPDPPMPSTLTSCAPLPLSIPKQRKPIADIVEELRNSSWYTGQIVPDGHRVVEAQDAVYGDLDFLLSQDVVNALYNALGITQLYSHQAAAVNALHAGDHVVVTTATSSGKSLIYQLPVVHAMEEAATAATTTTGTSQGRNRDQPTALFLFPTKALAQDQLRSLQELLAFLPDVAPPGSVATYDGDTPWRDRSMIREAARIILSNPDMLHVAILPQERLWRSFLQRLRFVVVDELHYYDGLLGAHMAYLMRRLRRVCASLGNDRLQFVSCSATMAEPAAHFATIFGSHLDRPVHVIDNDGSPAGRKEFLCWNTPFRVPGDPASGRSSGVHETARLFVELILRGVRVLAFCRVREQVEKLVATIRENLQARENSSSSFSSFSSSSSSSSFLSSPSSAIAERVMAYRGGYTAQDRRRIEADMFSGHLVGIVATTALELGVDIGSLDCVISWGFPYTMANLRQQSGRAGRRQQDALAVLVGDAFATDQHYMQHPDLLYDAPHDPMHVVDLDNLFVREGHLQCAAYELPLDPNADARYFGPHLEELCRERLVFDNGFYHCHPAFRPQPWTRVPLRDVEEEEEEEGYEEGGRRGGGGGNFAVVDVGLDPPQVIEELEASRATFSIYDGAIFLHQGHKYLVRDFVPEKRMAKVVRVNVSWTTKQRDYTDVDAITTEAVRKLGVVEQEHASEPNEDGKHGKHTNEHTETKTQCFAYTGRVRITQQVFGFFKVDDAHDRILDAVYVDNPPVVRHSRGTWLDVSADGLAVLKRRRLNVGAAIHAAEHAVLGLLPTIVVSLPGDVRTECKSDLKEYAQRETSRKRPARLTFYDANGGGNKGFCSKAFDFIDRLLPEALDRVENCCSCAGAGAGAGSRSIGGCPECVVWQNCTESNNVLSRAGAVVVLRSLLGLPIDEEALPMGPEEGIPEGVETIVIAPPVPGRGLNENESAVGKRE